MKIITATVQVLLILPLLFNAVLCSPDEERQVLSLKFRSAREMLLNNLQASLNQSKGITALFDASEDDIKAIPIDMLAQTCQYLDPKSMKCLGCSSKYSHKAKKHAIKAILSEINEYFVFEENWFNELFYSVIISRIPPGIKSTDPRIHDHLMLLAVDYIENSLVDTLKIPKTLHLAIISFIYNIVYGLNEVVPLTFDNWIYNLGEKVQKYSLPQSLKYLDDYERARDHPYYHEIIEFIALNCREPKDFEKYPLVGDVFNTENPEIGKAVVMLFKNALIKDKLNVQESMRILGNLEEYPGYPVELLEKISWNQEVKSMVIDSPNYYVAWFFRDLFRISGDEVTDSLTYMWSCDFSKPFSIEEAQKYPDFNPAKLLIKLSYAKMPFLLQYDIISKFFDADLIPSKALRISTDLNWHAFEITLIESKHNLSIVDLRECAKYFTRHFEYASLFFKTRISQNNPLTVIFLFDYDRSFDFKSLIAKKNFNFNVAYKNDFDLSDNLRFKERYFYDDTKEPIFSFRQILAKIDDPFLYDQFGLTKPEDQIDSPEIITIIHSLKECFPQN